MSRHIPRFYLKHDINEQIFHIGSLLKISPDQMHHATKVLRLKVGDDVRVFNGNIGEWNCEICDIKMCTVRCVEQIRPADQEWSSPIESAPQTTSLINPGGRNKRRLTIAFSLINPVRMSFLIEKTTELGVAELIPVISQYTQQRKFNRSKGELVAIGACEQSGRLEPPNIRDAVTLEAFLKEFCKNSGKNLDNSGASIGNLARKLFVADEALKDQSSTNIDLTLPAALAVAGKFPVFLIGPEGGFSDNERDLFDKYGVHIISLGPDILRSETAAVAIASASALFAAP